MSVLFYSHLWAVYCSISMSLDYNKDILETCKNGALRCAYIIVPFLAWTRESV